MQDDSRKRAEKIDKGRKKIAVSTFGYIVEGARSKWIYGVFSTLEEAQYELKRA